MTAQTSAATDVTTSIHDCAACCRLTATRGYQGLVSRSRNQYQMRAWPCGTITQVGTAERAGEMRGRVAHRHDDVAGAHQRRQAIDVVGVVNVGEALDLDPELARERAALGRGVAILQVDEAAAGQPQQRFEIVQASRSWTGRRPAPC